MSQVHVHTDRPVRYRYRVERRTGDRWETCDGERLQSTVPLGQIQARDALLSAAERYPGQALRLVREIIDSAVVAELDPTPPAGQAPVGAGRPQGPGPVEAGQRLGGRQ